MSSNNVTQDVIQLHTVNRKHLARKFFNAVRDILAAPSHRDRQPGIALRYEHLIALRYPEPPSSSGCVEADT
jgi:hypothetical protein